MAGSIEDKQLVELLDLIGRIGHQLARLPWLKPLGLQVKKREGRKKEGRGRSEEEKRKKRQEKRTEGKKETKSREEEIIKL